VGRAHEVCCPAAIWLPGHVPLLLVLLPPVGVAEGLLWPVKLQVLAGRWQGGGLHTASSVSSITVWKQGPAYTTERPIKVN